MQLNVTFGDGSGVLPKGNPHLFQNKLQNSFLPLMDFSEMQNLRNLVISLGCFAEWEMLSNT